LPRRQSFPKLPVRRGRRPARLNITRRAGAGQVPARLAGRPDTIV